MICSALTLVLLSASPGDSLSPAKTPVKVSDGNGNAVTSTVVGPSRGLDVNVIAAPAAGGGTSSNFGAAFPAAGTAAGVRSSTGLMVPFQLDASGLLSVTATGTGTAGGPAAGVLTVQGITGMTPLLVGDGVGAFNVILDSGTLTGITNAVAVTNAGLSNLDVALSLLARDATLTGGTMKSIVRGGAKGATVAADVTSTAAGTDHNGLDVVLYDSGGRDLDYRQENENWNSADHGLLIFGRDVEGAPNKYRALRLDADGRLLSHIEDSSHTYTLDFQSQDFNTGGGTALTSLFGIALPSGTGPVPGGTATNPLVVSDGSGAMNVILDSGTLTGITNTVTVGQATGTNLHMVLDSGSVTANAGTNLNTSALALSATQTDGSQKSIVRGGAKGGTVAADVTSTTGGADHQALDVQVYAGGAAVNPTQIRALTSADTVTVTQGTGTNLHMVMDSGSVTSAISQATPGTTNAVEAPRVASANNDGACVSVGASTTVLASNASRREAVLCARIGNTDTTYLKLGATATSSDFPLEPGQCFSPTGNSVYTGVIDAIAASGTQSVCVMEWN